jgi:hypothetical protein
MREGADFVVSRDLGELVEGMNAITGEPLLTAAGVRREVEVHDRLITQRYSKDLQVTAINGARRYIGDRLIRVAAPHRLLDPKAGPLIAVRLNILSRKTLGGLESNLDGQVLRAGGSPLPGLYAAGEVSGFGGGGVHGYRSLEGTFVGGCMFTGRQAARGILSGL